MPTDRQANREAGGQTGGQRGGQATRKAGGRRGIRSNRHVDRQADGKADRQKENQKDRQTVRRADAQKGRQTDRKLLEYHFKKVDQRKKRRGACRLPLSPFGGEECGWVGCVYISIFIELGSNPMATVQFQEILYWL